MNTLIKGIGNREDGELCVMSLTALIAGEEHTDAPICASPALTLAAIRLNDGPWWSSDEERTAVLTPLAHEMVGTRNPALETRRTELCVRAVFALWAPRILEATGQANLIALAQELRAVDPISDQINAVSIARAAAKAAYDYSAATAAYDYSYVAGDVAGYAADAAVDYTAAASASADADADADATGHVAAYKADAAVEAACTAAHGLHYSGANTAAIIIRDELLALIREGIALS